VDLVASCWAFVYVGERGSFTLGAAAARIPQSVASRRIAALEKYLGAPLFDRSARQVALTPFGRDMLPAAEQLVRLAEVLEHDAETARRSPFRLAVPDICGTRELADLVADARTHGIRLDPHPATPAHRLERARSRQVRAALVAVPNGEGSWAVPLGLAGAGERRTGPLHLETLRAGRGSARRIRVRIQPEDDVPHLRDRLTRLGDAVGLQPNQVGVAASLVDATADVLDAGDLLLCSPAQAEELGLGWRPIGELPIARGYDLTAGLRDDAQRLLAPLHDAIGRCLGVEEVPV